MHSRLASIEHDGWELDDAQAIHDEFPDTFCLPAHEARHSLQPEQLVKLIFRIVTVDEADVEEVNVERMWVIVRGQLDGHYKGQLDNQPYCTDAMQPGMALWFLPRHVIAIHQ